MSYVALPNYPYSSTKYQGKRVQITRWQTDMERIPSPFYNPYYPKIMTMAANEALVDSGITEYFDPVYGYYRMYIGGKQSVGMVEGWVQDNATMVANTDNGIGIKSRVALTRRDINGNSLGLADIPAGVRLLHSGNLLAYNDGSMVYITGYETSGGSTVSASCFVNTNWASGSVSSYYIQFFAL